MKKTLALLLLLAGLSVEAQGRELFWTGADGALWDTHTTNWRNAIGNALSYQNGDIVYFQGTGLNAVKLVGELTPSGVYVYNEGGIYIFVGDGYLSGAMHLDKAFPGTLIISTDNNYTGGTLLSAGTLVMNSEKALGSGPVELRGGGELQLQEHTLYNSVTINGPQTTIGDGTLNGTLTMNAYSVLTLLKDTTITGAISLADGATLNLGKNTVSGAVTLSGSSATIGNGTIEGGLAVADNKSLAL